MASDHIKKYFVFRVSFWDHYHSTNVCLGSCAGLIFVLMKATITRLFLSVLTSPCSARQARLVMGRLYQPGPLGRRDLPAGQAGPAGRACLRYGPAWLVVRAGWGRPSWPGEGGLCMPGQTGQAESGQGGPGQGGQDHQVQPDRPGLPGLQAKTAVTPGPEHQGLPVQQRWLGLLRCSADRMDKMI